METAAEAAAAVTAVAAFELDRQQLLIGNMISSGSSSVVYVGKFAGQLVAVKVFRFEKLLSSKAYQDYSKECNLLQKLCHPHVVRFVGVCCEPPSLCIVTEYLGGGSLYNLLHGRSRRPPGTPPGALHLAVPLALRLACDVVAGMEYLHAQGVIHRDLKSANLLLDNLDRVKVADFGAARPQAGGNMTAETGTYRWMAPEVIDHKQYDQRVDVYSFGIVLWEMLTSQVPYAHLSTLAAAAAVVQSGLRPEVPAHVPPPLADLMVRCWAAESQSRPQFTQVAGELRIARELAEAGA